MLPEKILKFTGSEMRFYKIKWSLRQGTLFKFHLSQRALKTYTTPNLHALSLSAAFTCAVLKHRQSRFCLGSNSAALLVFRTVVGNRAYVLPRSKQPVY